MFEINLIPVMEENRKITNQTGKYTTEEIKEALEQVLNPKDPYIPAKEEENFTQICQDLMETDIYETVAQLIDLYNLDQNGTYELWETIEQTQMFQSFPQELYNYARNNKNSREQIIIDLTTRYANAVYERCQAICGNEGIIPPTSETTNQPKQR